MFDHQNQLHLIDFGLACRVHKKEDGEEFWHGCADPVFMALSATKEMPSRREDIESVLYTLMDAILRTQAAIKGEVDTDSRYLPWGSEDITEEECVRLKKKNAKNQYSDMYNAMPEEAANSLYKALKVVWKCKFEDTPPYQEITELLTGLCVPLSAPPPRLRGSPLRKAFLSLSEDLGLFLSSFFTGSKRPCL
jgi:hypothetical protein